MRHDPAAKSDSVRAVSRWSVDLLRACFFLVAAVACAGEAKSPVTADTMTAAEARDVIADRLQMLEIDPPKSRYGRVFVGGPQQARGRTFRVVFVAGLAERILVAQRDEIAFMQRWLRERRETVPDGSTEHMMMPGMDMKLMPGMLTAEQLIQLDKARGPEFDRLFLQFMIQHHEGALTMVDKLFAAQGAGQDEDVFKFAVDVHADQTTEINRMTLMLQSVR